jgi:hypothetical protein
LTYHFHSSNEVPPSRYASTGSYLHNPGSAPLQYETLGQVLRAAADRSPGRRALRSRHEGVSMTYEELLDQVRGVLEGSNVCLIFK